MRVSRPGHYDECTIPSYAHQNRLIAWIFWKRIESALSLCGDVRGKSVLAFGCGGGVTFLYLHRQGSRIAGCEEQFGEVAKQVCRRLAIPADMYREIRDIPSETFDRILALDVLEHRDDLDLFLDRFHRMSHEQTRLIVSGPTESLLYRIGRLLIGYSGQGKFHERNIYDVERRLSERGFKKAEVRTLYPPLVLFRITSWCRNG